MYVPICRGLVVLVVIGAVAEPGWAQSPRPRLSGALNLAEQVLEAVLAEPGSSAVADAEPTPEPPAAPPVDPNRGGRADILPANPAPRGGLLGGALRGPTLDIVRLNDALRKIIDPIFEGEADIERIYLELNPDETDVSADRATASAGVRLHRTAWSDEASNLTISASMRYAPPVRGPAELHMTGGFTLETDVPAMANHLMPIVAELLTAPPRRRLLDRFRPRVAESTPADEPVIFDAEKAIRERTAVELANAGTLHSFDELVDLFARNSAQRFEAFTEEIDSLRKAIPQVADPDRRQALEARLLGARQQRDRLLAIRPLVARGADGRAESLTVVVDDAPLAENLHFERLQVVVTPVGVHMELAGTLSQGVEIYGLLKPLAVAVLSRLQEGLAEDVDAYRRILEGYLQPQRAIILGD